ncbi:hypothetical protein [Micromonospora sp. CA-111912]|uniref:hypothetical protein n=1 Tax=Micromonospora sp. CA-111912 TaxID=3239955 RepID=UPI003D8F2CA4
MSKSRRRLLSAGVLAGLTMALLPQAPQAQAALVPPPPACTWESHCYGVITWPHADVSGAEAEIGTYSMYVPDTGSQFATSEMWVNFDHPTASAWVEFGVIRFAGYPCGNGAPHWFSAAGRPGYAWEMRCHGSAALNTKSVLRAEEPSNGTWDLYRNGAYVTRWSGTPASTSNLDVGVEVTNPSTVLSMTAGKLKYRTAADKVWKTGWASPSYPVGQPDPSGTPCYTLWVASPTDMRARCNTDGTLATGSPAAAPGQGRPSGSVADKAQRLAAWAGDAGATSVRSMRSSGAEAAARLGTDVGTDRAVTVVELDGDFTGEHLPRPRGAAAQSGEHLTLVFDEAGDLLTMRLARQP